MPITQYEELKNKFPEIVAYPLTKGTVKLAAGWMIEQCGPDKMGQAGKDIVKVMQVVMLKQALVLVNYGNAKGNEIYDLSEQILKSVNKNLGCR